MTDRMEVLRRVVSIKEMLCREMLRAFEQEGFSNTELMVIYHLQHGKGPWKAGDLSEALFLPMSTLTGIIDKMVERRILRRQRSIEDRRVVYIEIEPAFIEEGAKYMEKMTAVMEQIAAEMGPAAFGELNTSLGVLERAIKKRKG